MFTGYRVIHNTARGPGKGGIRLRYRRDSRRGPRACRVDDLEMCCLSSPVRGARVAFYAIHPGCQSPARASHAPLYITHNKDARTRLAVQRPTSTPMSRSWRAARHLLDARWRLSSSGNGKTYCPRRLTRPRGRYGTGCLLVIQQALNHLGMTMSGTTVAVQGLGKWVEPRHTCCTKRRESWSRFPTAAARIQRQGNRHPAALEWISRNTLLEGFPGGEAIGNDDLISLDVDVLVPAALENVITSENAGRVRARIVCEGANGPTTAAADDILEAKGVFVIPDILANAGGVTVRTSSGFRTEPPIAGPRASSTTGSLRS